VIGTLKQYAYKLTEIENLFRVVHLTKINEWSFANIEILNKYRVRD